MFDIGFFEFMVIGIVVLFVIGFECLLKVVWMIGYLFGCV